MRGIAKDKVVPIVGMVVLRLQFKQLDGQPSKEIKVRCKILGKGHSDWLGVILGGKTLDCGDHGGLGFRPGPRAHVLVVCYSAFPTMAEVNTAL